MATVYFIGKAANVAQISTVQITGLDATPSNNTFHLTCGNQSVSAVGNTDVNTTAADLATAWNDSTHIYFTDVTASSSTDTVTLTADTAGLPHEPVSSVTGGGTGTIGAVTVTTANDGPEVLDSANNWSGSALPSNSDTLVFADLSSNVLWGLGDLTTTGHVIKIFQSFTGSIGLPYETFQTNATTGTDSTAEEYRETYCTLDWSTLEIGQNLGPSLAAGSSRLKFNNDRASASTTRIINTATVGQGSKPAVMLLLDDDDADVIVQSAPGGVGLAVDEPDETSNALTFTITDTSQSSRIQIGAGVSWKASTGVYRQEGGVCLFSDEAGTLPTMTINGGTIDATGAHVITTLNVGGNGVANMNSTGTITTANVSDTATLDMQGNSEAKTITNLNITGGGTFKGNDSVTVTNLNEPTTGNYTITIES